MIQTITRLLLRRKSGGPALRAAGNRSQAVAGADQRQTAAEQLLRLTPTRNHLWLGR